jgi:transposase
MSNQTAAVHWRRRVESWKRSGQSAAEYAARHGIGAHQLYCWSWRLRKETASPQGARARKKLQPVQFLPVKVAPGPIATTEPRVRGAELMLAGGAVLRVVEGSDPAWAAQLIARVVLESGSC